MSNLTFTRSALMGLLSVSALLAGCGGGGGSSAVSPSTGLGSAVVKILWPNRTRLIPEAANSIAVTISLSGSPAVTQVIPRPAAGTTSTQTTFNNLAYGNYTTAIQAFPNSDGTGVAQASGNGSMTVAEGVPGAVTVSLVSTAATLSITPANPTIDKLATTHLTVSALDANGNVVLLSAGGGNEPISWTSDTVANATISGTGPTATLSGVHSGSANITASFVTDDAGDKISATVLATINPIKDGTGIVTVK